MSRMTTKEFRKRTTEADVQKQIREYLDLLPRCYYVWHRMDRATTCEVGTPDFVGVIRGVAFLLEVKKHGKKPEPKQIDRLFAASMAGATAGWCDSFDGALRFFDHIP